MNTISVLFLTCLVGLIFLAQDASGVLLGPLLMALKGGMFASKMGVGGMIALMLAASHNQQTDSFDSGLANKRATRSIPENVSESLSAIARVVVSDDSLVANRTEIAEIGSGMSVEKLAEALNNAGLPATKRVMRQVAILDQLSCLPKVICGMNAKSPSKNTNILNDYGFLLKYLFQSDDADDDKKQDDDEADDDEQDDDERDIEDEEDEALRTGGLVTKRKGDDNKNRKTSTEATNDDESSEDGEIDQQAQDELLDDEPEMMRYVLAEMKDKMNDYKHQVHKVHISGYPQESPDHSDLPGYDRESYSSYKNPALSTASSQAILNEPYTSSLLSGLSGGKGSGVLFGNKNIQLKLGSSDESPSLLGALLPSFVYKKIKSPDTHGPSGDPFADDPFFADFRRRDLKFQRNIKPDDNSKDTSANANAQAERTNSRFKKIVYIAEKKEELEQSTDPLTKYKVAADVGRKTKSGRQCRLLFAKCPYEYNEIMTMIDNVKKVVTADSGLNSGAQSDSLGSGVSTISTGPGNIVNVQSGDGGKPGVTQISHQLDNGDKVEIMLKIKPKDGKLSSYQVFPKKEHQSQFQTSELSSADKSLTEMKKALHALVKLHNQTESKLKNLQSQKATIGPYRIRNKINGFGANPTSATTGLPKPQQNDQDDQDQADTNTSNSSSKEKSSEETKVPPKLKEVTDDKNAGGDKKNKHTNKNKTSQSKEKEDDETSDEEDQDEEEYDIEDDAGNGNPTGGSYGFPSSMYRPNGAGHQQPGMHFFRQQPTGSNFYMGYPSPPSSLHHARLPHSSNSEEHEPPKPKRRKQRPQQKAKSKTKQEKQEAAEPTSTQNPKKRPETENPRNKARLPSPLPSRPSSYKIIRPSSRYRPRNDKLRSGIKIIPELATVSGVNSDEDERR